MIILGLILLLIGFLAKIAIVWAIGIVVLAVGLLFVLLGTIGRGVVAGDITGDLAWADPAVDGLPGSPREP